MDGFKLDKAGSKKTTISSSSDKKGSFIAYQVVEDKNNKESGYQVKLANAIIPRNLAMPYDVQDNSQLSGFKT